MPHDKATLPELVVGRSIVVIGHGVARVVATDDERTTVAIDDGTGEATIATRDAGKQLRPVVDPATAQRMLERLCEPCTEARELAVLRSLRELARSPLEQQVEYCRWYFRKKKALREREREPAIVMQVSDLVLGELAVALETDVDSVRSAVKRGRPHIVTRVVRTFPAPPTIPGATFLRSFWTSGELVVAEYPENDTDRVRVSVEPGAWHAFAYESDEEHEESGIVLLHARHMSRIPTPHEVGAAGVDGGRIGVLDLAALGDPDMGPDEVERLRERGEGYGDRGVESGTYGDGDHAVRVDDRRVATALFVSF